MRDPMKTTLNIKGMHCTACEMLLTEVLEELPGVKKVNVSLKSHSATVEHETTTSAATLKKAVEAEGYKVE
jgi:copper chaperone CopZ